MQGKLQVLFLEEIIKSTHMLICDLLFRRRQLSPVSTQLGRIVRSCKRLQKYVGVQPSPSQNTSQSQSQQYVIHAFTPSVMTFLHSLVQIPPPPNTVTIAILCTRKPQKLLYAGPAAMNLRLQSLPQHGDQGGKCQ